MTAMDELLFQYGLLEKKQKEPPDLGQIAKLIKDFNDENGTNITYGKFKAALWDAAGRPAPKPNIEVRRFPAGAGGIRSEIKRSWYDQKDRENIIKLYEEGRDTKEISEDASIGIKYVNHCVRMHLLEEEKPEYSPEKVKELYERGFTYEELGEVFNREITQLRWAVRKLNVKRTPYGFYSKPMKKTK